MGRPLCLFYVWQVEPNRRVFLDVDLFFDVVPPELSHDRMTYIQTASSEVYSVGPTVFSFDTSRPIKVGSGVHTQTHPPSPRALVLVFYSVCVEVTGRVSCGMTPPRD